MSDSGVLRRALAVEAAARDVLMHKRHHLELQRQTHAMRRASAVSVGPVMVHQQRQQQQQVNCGVQSTSTNPADQQQQQQQSFLLRERVSGEEVVVTMRPVGGPVQGARTVVARIPSYLSSSSSKRILTSPTPPLPLPPQIVVGRRRKRRSLDDVEVDYDSLLPPTELRRRLSEVGDEVLAANRLEKAYARYRRRVRAANSDDGGGGGGGDLELSVDDAESEHGRISEWVRRDREERRRRRSCAVGEFASQAASRARTPLLVSPGVGGGRSRSRSMVGDGDGLVAMAASVGGGDRERSLSAYSIGNSGNNRRASGLPRQQSTPMSGGEGGQQVHLHLPRRRSRCGSGAGETTITLPPSQQRATSPLQQQQLLLHQRHHRPNGGHDTTADLEEAAQRLLYEVAPGHPGLVVNDLGDHAPPEKERRRMVLVVSCVALAITVFAALLVGLTLGLSHLLEDLTPGRNGRPGHLSTCRVEEAATVFFLVQRKSTFLCLSPSRGTHFRFPPQVKSKTLISSSSPSLLSSPLAEGIAK